METFILYHLASISKHRIDTAAAAIVLAQRVSNAFLSNEEKYRLELVGGAAIIDTLVNWRIENELDDESCVWKKN